MKKDRTGKVDRKLSKNKRYSHPLLTLTRTVDKDEEMKRLNIVFLITSKRSLFRKKNNIWYDQTDEWTVSWPNRQREFELVWEQRSDRVLLEFILWHAISREKKAAARDERKAPPKTSWMKRWKGLKKAEVKFNKISSLAPPGAQGAAGSVGGHHGDAASRALWRHCSIDLHPSWFSRYMPWCPRDYARLTSPTGEALPPVCASHTYTSATQINLLGCTHGESE